MQRPLKEDCSRVSTRLRTRICTRSRKDLLDDSAGSSQVLLRRICARSHKDLLEESAGSSQDLAARTCTRKGFTGFTRISLLRGCHQDRFVGACGLRSRNPQETFFARIAAKNARVQDRTHNFFGKNSQHKCRGLGLRFARSGAVNGYVRRILVSQTARECRGPKSRRRLCASLRNQNAHGHRRRADNLRQKSRRAPCSKTGLYPTAEPLSVDTLFGGCLVISQYCGTQNFWVHWAKMDHADTGQHQFVVLELLG